MKCCYAEHYGGGRTPGTPCQRTAVFELAWYRNRFDDLMQCESNVKIIVCRIHARAIAARYPMLGGIERFERVSLVEHVRAVHARAHLQVAADDDPVGDAVGHQDA